MGSRAAFDCWRCVFRNGIKERKLDLKHRRKSATIATRTVMEWKPKYLLILLLIFLLENQTSSTVLPYSESNVESYIVDRKPIGADYFFVKSNPLCRGVWCGTVFSGTYRAVSGGNTCECECTSQSLSFVPSRQTCSNATTAADFGG